MVDGLGQATTCSEGALIRKQPGVHRPGAGTASAVAADRNPPQRLVGDRATAGYMHVEEFAPVMDRHASSVGPSAKQRLVPQVIVYHQMAAQVIQEGVRTGAGAASLVVELAGGLPILVYVRAVSPQVAVAGLATANGRVGAQGFRRHAGMSVAAEFGEPVG